MTSEPRSLTDADKLHIFCTVTRGFARRHSPAFGRGMTDDDLANALGDAFGIMGGRAAPDEPYIVYQGAGLKIWGGWTYQTPRDRPIFTGAATIAMARRVYGIADPSERQLALF